MADEDGWHGAQALFWDAVRATGDVFYVLRVAPDVAYEFVSDSVTDLDGYTPQEHYDDPDLVQRLVDPRDLERLTAALSRTECGYVDVELRSVHRDGHRVWTQQRARTRVRDDGSVVVEGSVRDITSLRQAQEALAATAQELKALTDSITDLVARTGPDHTIEYVSPSVTTVLGWQPEDVVGHRYDEFWDPEDLAAAAASQPEPGTREPVRFRARARCRDGAWRWMEIVGSVVVGHGGRSGNRIIVARDVEDQVRAEQALTAAAQEFQVIAENISDVIMRTGPDLTIEYVSPSITALSGWQPAELVGANNLDLFHPDDLGAMAAAREEGLAGDAVRFRARARSKDGTYQWVEIAGNVVRAEDGSPLYGVTIARDISAQIAAERALAESEERFRLAMLEAPQGMAVLGLDQRFIAVNPALCRMLGRDEGWLLAHTAEGVIHPEDRGLYRQTYQPVQIGQAPTARQTLRLLTADDSHVWADHAIGLLRDGQGNPRSFVAHYVDVTQERRNADALRFQASHDPLTSLINRRELTTRMELALSHRARTGARLAVLFIDVDRLKPINDTHGHAVGDYLLVQVAQRISAAVRAEDVVARVGGDEFVVLLTGVRDDADAERVATHVHAAITEPIAYNDTELHPSVSIGVALAQPGQDVDAVLRDADTALYEAKAAGRDRVVPHSAAITHLSAGGL